MLSSKVALFVLCTRPGLIRAGVPHPACKAHPLDAFTEPQLQEMLREPAISLVVGSELVSDRLGDFLATTTADRTHLVGSTVDTDAGANAVTDALAEAEGLRADVAKGEAQAGGVPGAEGVKTRGRAAR